MLTGMASHVYHQYSFSFVLSRFFTRSLWLHPLLPRVYAIEGTPEPASRSAAFEFFNRYRGGSKFELQSAGIATFTILGNGGRLDDRFTLEFAGTFAVVFFKMYKKA